ncbi:hypothetical protein QUF82_01265 [Thiotrichales bacterium HSG14]|nr:hypothetical protein [Thiotrichales bacterium HSG14]
MSEFVVSGMRYDFPKLRYNLGFGKYAYSIPETTIKFAKVLRYYERSHVSDLYYTVVAMMSLGSFAAVALGLVALKVLIKGIRVQLKACFLPWKCRRN